jgi:hypothetical protein
MDLNRAFKFRWCLWAIAVTRSDSFTGYTDECNGEVACDTDHYLVVANLGKIGSK